MWRSWKIFTWLFLEEILFIFFLHFWIKNKLEKVLHDISSSVTLSKLLLFFNNTTEFQGQREEYRWEHCETIFIKTKTFYCKKVMRRKLTRWPGAPFPDGWAGNWFSRPLTSSERRLQLFPPFHVAFVWRVPPPSPQWRPHVHGPAAGLHRRPGQHGPAGRSDVPQPCQRRPRRHDARRQLQRPSSHQDSATCRPPAGRVLGEGAAIGPPRHVHRSGLR